MLLITQSLLGYYKNNSYKLKVETIKCIEKFLKREAFFYLSYKSLKLLFYVVIWRYRKTINSKQSILNKRSFLYYKYANILMQTLKAWCIFVGSCK